MNNSTKTKVYALFDDSSADEIVFSYFGAPINQNIPIRAYSNDIQDLDVQRSVLDGASAALANYEKYFKSAGDRYCFAYKFINDQTNQAITGKSAGLAFCIKFALKLYKNIIDKELKFSIAATGIIEIDEDTSFIKPVTEINNKIDAALNSLEPGDLFFYPLANEHQADRQLIKKITKNGISVHAVETVDQAIAILFDGHIKKSGINKSPNNTKYKGVLTAIFFIIIFVSLYFIFIETNVPCYDEVLKNLESGEYIRAKEISESCLQESENDSIKNLLTKINSELKLSSDFIYVKNNIFTPPDTNSNSPLLLGIEDGYRFEVKSPEDCFLYIFQFDSETETERLFPLSAFILNQHYLLKNKVIQIPGGENMFYLNDKDHHGIITIFIIASQWRLKDLEEIYNKYEDNEVRQSKRKFRNALINRIKHCSEIKESNIKSLFLKELTFIQQ